MRCMAKKKKNMLSEFATATYAKLKDAVRTKV